MSENTCDELADQLVEYADGELSAEESAAVAEHVAACPRCRETLAALRQSLHLAEAIWEAGESDLAGVRIPARRSWASRLRRPAMAAAVVLLVVGGSSLWRQATRPTPVVQPVAAAPTAAELQLAVARAGVAAGLVGAADYLAEQPGGQEIAVQRLHYVIQTYPETQGAALAKARLQSPAPQRGQL